ncbi:MAG: glutaryl-CoA dehydrogenase [Mycobacterium sp.]|jgi:hypothetical protein|nr:glutaryl-CoA dehydrogenase [Mycobacterium sp.]
MPTRIEDLLDLDSLLTPEDIELRQTVRRFGEQRRRTHVADWFETGPDPFGRFRHMTAIPHARLGRATLPAAAPKVS